MINEKALYVRKSDCFPDNEDFGGLALYVEISNTGHENTGEQTLWFYDTDRWRCFTGVITEKGDTITMKREDMPYHLVLKVCTLDMFRRKYYKLACGGEKIAEACKTDDDLWTWYRNHF